MHTYARSCLHVSERYLIFAVHAMMRSELEHHVFLNPFDSQFLCTTESLGVIAWLLHCTPFVVCAKNMVASRTHLIAATNTQAWWPVIYLILTMNTQAWCNMHESMECTFCWACVPTTMTVEAPSASHDEINVWLPCFCAYTHTYIASPDWQWWHMFS
jgi:hypothetical protein